MSDTSAELRADVRNVVVDVLDKGDASWQALADAGICSLAVPEQYDGSGLGAIALGVVVDEVASRAVDLPVRDTLFTGLLTVLAAGDEATVEAVAPRVGAGELRIVAAMGEPGAPLTAAPTTYVDQAGVHGTKTHVALAPEGVDSLLLVTLADGRAALVDPAGAGVTVVPTTASSGLAEASVVLDGAPPVHLLGDGSAAVARDHALGGIVAEGAGLLRGARDLTSGYIDERTQFGRKLAEFQAVAMQIADVFVTSRLLGLAADEVQRRLEAGQVLDADAAVAAYVLCARAPKALQTCHHLHGGMGVDETYPLHRYFARTQDLGRLLGGPATTLAAVPVADGPGKGLELTDEQRAFKRQARDYFAGLLTRDDRIELMTDRHGAAYHRTIKKMGADGWMGVGWPVEYGGKGLGGIEQQIFANEASYADVHLPSVTLQTVGPTLQAFGTQVQKDRFLGDILTGDVHFAIGYSEPDAGTDLASLRCAARRDEATGDWIVNGQKMWTTGGHAADYIWLAVRTDPDAPKHKGITVLIVDTTDPGYTWTPIITCEGSHHVNATYYNEVRVPADMVVGEVNEGWRLITAQLNHERIMLGPAGRLEGLRDLVARWAADRVDAAGTPLLEVRDIRDVLARVTAAARVNELLNWAVASGATTGGAAIADASASKVFASDEVQSLGLDLLAVVTTYGDPAEPETAFLVDYLDKTAKRNLVLTFGGGVNEVQRELIAMFGLGLPKVPR